MTRWGLPHSFSVHLEITLSLCNACVWDRLHTGTRLRAPAGKAVRTQSLSAPLHPASALTLPPPPSLSRLCPPPQASDCCCGQSAGLAGPEGVAATQNAPRRGPKPSELQG